MLHRLLVPALSLVAILAPVEAKAQLAGMEGMIEQSRASIPVQESQAQARAQPPRTGDKHELSIFYHKRGIANSRLGRYTQAVDDLRLALENNQPGRPTPQEWGNRWQIQVDLASAHRSHGDWFLLIELWNSVAREYQQSNLIIHHTAHLHLVDAYSALGQWAEADQARQNAEATLPRLRSTSLWARYGYYALQQHEQYMAGLFSLQGNYAEAERRYRASLEAAEKFLEATRGASGNNYLRGAATLVRGAKLRLAQILSTRGKYAEAEAYARTGLDDTLALYGYHTVPVGNALAVVGSTRLQQGDLAGAEKYYRHALAAVDGSDVARYSTNLASRRRVLADVLMVQGRWNDAIKLFDERDQGLRSSAVQFKRTNSISYSWAYALHKTGDSRRAAEMLERLAAGLARRPVPNRWTVALVRGLLGMALAGTGRTVDALQAFRESVPELIRYDQDDSTTDTGSFLKAFWQRVILESYLELLAMLHASGAVADGLDVAGESFWVADVARGSTVQVAINGTAARAQLPDRDLTELARREQDGIYRITALHRVLVGLAGSADERTAKILSDVRAEIERLRREHATLRAEIRNRYPAYAELIDPKPAGIADVHKALAPGEALVSIYLGESQAYVWTIASDGRAAFRAVPIKRDAIEAEVHELRRAMDFGGRSAAQLRPFDLVRAHNLYRAFFEPDEALWKDVQVLNVIPHGALGELPFALLVTAPSQQPSAGALAAYAGVPWLMRKAGITQLPSASAFTALRRTPTAKAQRQPFIGFGDPLFTADPRAGAGGTLARNLAVRKATDTADDRLNAAMRSGGKEPRATTLVSSVPTLALAFARLSSLPDTSEELREIAATLKADPARDVFLDRQATERNVKQTRLDNTRVLAFATHGIAPGELTGLDQPALALSNPALTGDSDNDGFLTMEEVLGLKLDADWVVLSACNTGSADGRGSEAVSGLGRAFFYAGARSLLVSNWAVETTSAKLLTTELFRRQAADPQMTRAEALRQSMLDLMGKTAAGGFSYAHPAFWAPFSLIGDGGR